MSRLIVLRVALVLVVAIFVGRLYQLQVADHESRRYSADVAVTTRRYITVPPRRGEIFAADGRTLLAESVPIYNLAVIPGRLPSRSAEPERRADVLARLTQVAGLTSTLTLSPTSILAERPTLRAALSALQAPTPGMGPTLSVTEAPADSLRALELSRAHGDVLTLSNPIEELIARQDLRNYQGVVIKEDIGPDLALAIRENSNYLPGVEVIEAYRRRYPLSGAIPSLSHLLGYTGRINECELLAVNPASSWLTALVDVLGLAGRCGLIVKPVDPPSIGFPPYQVDDRIGKDGLEAAYESELRGRAGVESLLVDVLQRPIGPVETIRPVEHGHNLVLTIDVAYQAEVERILRRWIAEGERRRQNAREAYKRDYAPIFAGVAVALDPRDGRVLALASLPAYDNNVWVDPARREELLALLTSGDPEALAELLRQAPLTNRAISGQYPPGSTLKQFVGAIALQEGVIAPDTRLRDPGVLKLIERNGAPFELPNSIRNRDNGELTVIDALRLSSNVFFASVAGGNDQATNLDAQALRIRGLDIDRLVQGLEWFHLGRITGIDLAGEAPGLVPTKTWKAQAKREVWTTGDTYNTAIGQGDMLVTPLQLAVAASGIATDGAIYRPHVVAAITDGSGAVVRQIGPELLSRVPVDPAFLQVIREGMRQSVTNGLNVAAREECSGLRIAGKTGTAEFGPLIKRPDGRFVRQSHAWFVGFAPYEDPQVVVAVLLEGVGDLNDGSSTMAVPAVTQMLQAFFGTEPPANPPPFCPAMPPDPAPAPPTVGRQG
ncbi:MAG: penicillin-binding transpeptidase domain-containing protein [Chloroflexaceae bacterium]|nr:penicillin-binding transpeptidase domain-containing protein [Chloroflexaceae bacterium]